MFQGGGTKMNKVFYIKINKSMKEGDKPTKKKATFELTENFIGKGESFKPEDSKLRKTKRIMKVRITN